VDVLRAPKDQLDSLGNIVDSHNLTTAKNDDLGLQRLIEEINGEYIHHFDRYVPNHGALAMLYRQASDFELVQKPEGERRPFAPFVTTRNTMTRDWADFALDSMPLKDPDGTIHVATIIRYWSSSTGQH
jgi:hypothetical protein